VAEIFQDIGDVWRRAGLVRRVMVVMILLGCIAAAALLVNWMRKPEMALLYANIPAREAAKVVEKLRDADLPYELKNGGTTIYIPAGQVYSMRLKMASEGLPTDDQPGYSILDNESFGASPFKQRVNYQRAIEGELAKSIEIINGVISARVHIAQPNGTLFARKKKNSSATVVLKLKTGKRLTGTNIDAIVHLVAGGVEGLGPDDVVVVDSTGALLSGATGDDLTTKAGTFLAYKTQVEQYLSKKAEDMLSSVLGPNKVSVRVAATIKTDSVTSTKETYDPTGKVVTREQLSSSSSSAGDAKAAASGNGTTTKEETTSTDYLVGKTVEATSQLPGQIESLSVAAFVDLSPPADQSGKEGGKATPTLTIKDVEDILRDALGLTQQDQLKVVSASFNTPAPPADKPVDEGLFSYDKILQILRNASLGLLVIGALLVLKIMGGKKSKKDDPGLSLETSGADGDHLLTASSPQIDPELVRNRITRALQENPDQVKRLFLSWVQDGNGEQ